MGTTAGKTIHSLEIGADLQIPLHVSIQYSRDKRGVFASTPAQVVVSRGRTYITAHGKEFRFNVRTLAYTSFKLEYIVAHVTVHGS